MSIVSIGMWMLSPGVSHFVLAQGQPDAYAVALADLEVGMNALELMHREIDRTLFDIDALALELAFEPAEQIVAWVRESIRFEPYEGLLRGPEGTLRGRAGNPLDQAVLLARLLSDAGYEARISVASLEERHEDVLMEQMLLPQPVPPPWYSEDTLDEIARVVDTLDVTMDDELQFVRDPEAGIGDRDEVQEAWRTARTVLDELAAAGIRLGGSNTAPELLGNTSSYAWVQFRQSPTDAWVDAHPAFREVPDGLPSEPLEIFESSVPATMQHRIRVQAVLELQIGDETREAPIMDVWERPAANAADVAVPFTLIPDTATEQDSDALSSAGMFYPLLLGEVPPGGMAFDLSGNMAPVSEASTPFAGVFQSLAQDTNRAAGAIGGLGSDDDADGLVSLEAVHLDIGLVAPDGTERTFRHPVASRTESGSDEAFVEELLGIHSIAIDVGGLSQAAAVDQVLEKIVGIKPLMEGLLAEQYGSTVEDGVLSDEEVAMLADARMQSTLLLHGFASATETELGIQAFRTEPAVLVYKYLYLPDRLEESINILTSTWAIVEASEDGIRPRHDLSVQQGVWEAYFESLFLSELALAPVQSTANAMRHAQSEDSTYRVLESVADLSTVEDLGPKAASILERDLASDHVIVIPTAQPEGYVGWWRVDPKSGETLGVIDAGTGGARMTSDAADSPDRVIRLVQDATEDIVVRSGSSLATRYMADFIGSLLVCAFLLVMIYILVGAVLGLVVKMITSGNEVLGAVLGALAKQLVGIINAPKTRGPEYRAWMGRCVRTVSRVV